MPRQSDKTDVFVVDDDAAVLDAIKLLLANERLHGRYFETAEAMLRALAKMDAPHCVVSDVRMPGMSGLELQSELAARSVATKLILITGHGDIDMAVKAVKAGAHDFLEKPFNPDCLVASIRRAIEQAGKAQSTQLAREDLLARVAQLSERQREVMDLAVLGYSNKEIAQQMGISPRTVESYRAWVMEKTGAANLAELVRIAVQLEEGR